MKKLMTIVTVLCAALLCSAVRADLRLPSIFSNGMVLQRDRPVTLWGWSDPGSRIHILLATHGATPTQSITITTRADASGRWSATLGKEDHRHEDPNAEWALTITEHPGSTPAPEMTITAEGTAVSASESDGRTTHLDRVRLTDILIGEVWICSGQSNMEWSINESDGDGRSREAMANPRLRLINAPHRVATTPQPDIEARWEVCTPETLGSWSAVGYFFGDRLTEELDVPVGLISTNWGGTRIEPWIDRADLAAHPRFAARTAALQKQIAQWNALGEERINELKATADQALARDRARYWQRINREDRGHQSGWMNVSFDDSDWKRMNLPAEWERADAQLDDFDGTVWFRKSVTVPEEWVGRSDIVLNLGGVDDSDQTYVNGTLVGTSTDQVGNNRRYPVSAEVLGSGTAVIAVCALDPHGAGGMIGPRITLNTADGLNTIDLRGPWRWKAGLQTTRTVQSRVPQPNNPGAESTAYGALNDAMISPFVPYSIRGALWYQGEANEHEADEYRELLPLLIESWRSDFGKEMAFGIVQLAAYRATSEDPDQGGWAHLRDAQRHASETVPNTGLVVTTDVGAADDIHPRNKKAVGDRLADWALHDVYGDDEAVPSGPIARDATRSEGGVLVNFEYCRGGLAVARSGGNPGGFALAGPDGRFFWAEAAIVGKNQVRVESNDVPDPRIVSYGWQDNPVRANLMNASRLPACPFKLEVGATGRD